MITDLIGVDALSFEEVLRYQVPYARRAIDPEEKHFQAFQRELRSSTINLTGCFKMLSSTVR